MLSTIESQTSSRSIIQTSLTADTANCKTQNRIAESDSQKDTLGVTELYASKQGFPLLRHCSLSTLGPGKLYNLVRAAEGLKWVNLTKVPMTIHSASDAVAAVAHHHGIDLTGEMLQDLQVRPYVLPQHGFTKDMMSEAALLYKHTRISDGSDTNGAFDLSQLRSRLETDLYYDNQQLKLFRAQNTNTGTRPLGFNNITITNSAYLSFKDLVNHPEVITALPDLSPTERQEVLARYCDRHGIDRNFTFGTIEHAMASVIKSITGRNVRTDLFTEFNQLCEHWDQSKDAAVNPRLLLAMHMASETGETIGATGTPVQRLQAWQTYLAERVKANDYTQAPKFDRRAAALKILSKKTGFSEDVLSNQKREYSQHIQGSAGSSTIGSITGITQTQLAHFIQIADSGVNSTMRITRADGSSETIRPGMWLQSAEEEFNANLLDNEWVHMRARDNLRIRGEFPWTQAKWSKEVSIIVEKIKTPTERQIHSEEQMAQLRRVPIFGAVFSFFEGVATHNVDEILGSIPIVGSLYNVGEGIRTHNGLRVVKAIPVIGDIEQIREAIRDGNGEEIRDVFLNAEFNLTSIAEGARIPNIKNLPHQTLRGLRQTHTVAERLGLGRLVGIKTKDSDPTNGIHEWISHPNDPYGISNETATQLQSSNLKAYRLIAENHELLPPNVSGFRRLANEASNANPTHIKLGDYFYRTKEGPENQTQIVYERQGQQLPPISVEYVEGKWRVITPIDQILPGIKQLNRDGLTEQEINRYAIKNPSHFPAPDSSQPIRFDGKHLISMQGHVLEVVKDNNLNVWRLHSQSQYHIWNPAVKFADGRWQRDFNVGLLGGQSDYRLKGSNLERNIGGNMTHKTGPMYPFKTIKNSDGSEKIVLDLKALEFFPVQANQTQEIYYANGNLIGKTIGAKRMDGNRIIQHFLEPMSGSGTYSNFARFVSFKGNMVVNDTNPFVAITQRQIVDAPESVQMSLNQIKRDIISIGIRHGLQFNQDLEIVIPGVGNNQPLEISQARAQTYWNTINGSQQVQNFRAEVTNYFHRRLSETLNHNMPPDANGHPVVRNTPDTAATYYLLQNNSRSGDYVHYSRPRYPHSREFHLPISILNFRDRRIMALDKRMIFDQKLLIFNALHRRRELEGTTNFFTQDGWEIIDQARAGSLVVMSGHFHDNFFSFPDFTQKLNAHVLPAADRGARFIIVNKFTQEKFDRFTAMGFKTSVHETEGRTRGTKYIVAINYDLYTDELDMLPLKPLPANTGGNL